MDLVDVIAIDDYKCPKCKQDKGEHCINKDKKKTDVHQERHDELTQRDWNYITVRQHNTDEVSGGF